MNVLMACEESGVVRDAFRARGHSAWSMDLLPNDSPYHHQGDVVDFFENHACQMAAVDMIIAFPPCTYLCNSGVTWLVGKQAREGRWRDMLDGAELFKAILDADCPKIAVENSIPHRYAIEAIGRPYDQCIQPYMFGHPESKATCLWLKGLPPLMPTNDVRIPMSRLPKKEQQKTHYMSPSKDRGILRSKTFQGIADAMAEQWG